jgi:hypothetical protein
MAHNTKRTARMAQLSIAELKRRVDSGSLSSAAASYALRQQGVVYVKPVRD